MDGEYKAILVKDITMNGYHSRIGATGLVYWENNYIVFQTSSYESPECENLEPFPSWELAEFIVKLDDFKLV